MCRLLGLDRPVRDGDVPDADVVIATWWETAEWVAAPVAPQGDQGSLPDDYETFGGAPRADRRDLPTADAPIIIAEWVGRPASRERFGVADTTLVPLAADPSLFHAPPRGKQPRPTVGLTYTSFRNKGCDISLRASRAVRRVVPELRLVAFGSNRPTADVPLPAGVEFLGRLPNDELRHAYARCDAWLFGTRIEGFGLPILEAMACRTPVIGTPAGAAPELIAGGGGLLVRPEDPGDMADAIVRLCRLPDPEWRLMSEAAHATAARYTWDEATDRFERALEVAIERAAGGAGPGRPVARARAGPAV